VDGARDEASVDARQLSVNALLLLARYGSASLRGQMQYPGSALMLATGQFSQTIIDLVAIWALFHRFGSVQGWRFGDVAMFFGLVSISFAVANFISRGFDVLGTEFIKTGNFDRILLRPRTATLQLVGHDFRLIRAGRFLQGLVVVAIATTSLDFHWRASSIALAVWTVVGGVALFFGLMVLQGALSFWTTESLEAMNLLTDGGVLAAEYPLSIYERWFRSFLIFVVPIGCVAYFPVLAILGLPDPLGAPDWLLPLTPLAGFAFLGVSFLPWRAGVRKYTSTGS
jgi:ABC-2 type transport system permease protein